MEEVSVSHPRAWPSPEEMPLNVHAMTPEGQPALRLCCLCLFCTCAQCVSTESDAYEVCRLRTWNVGAYRQYIGVRAQNTYTHLHTCVQCRLPSSL